VTSVVKEDMSKCYFKRVIYIEGDAEGVNEPQIQITCEWYPRLATAPARANGWRATQEGEEHVGTERQKDRGARQRKVEKDILVLRRAFGMVLVLRALPANGPRSVEPSGNLEGNR